MVPRVNTMRAAMAAVAADGVAAGADEVAVTGSMTGHPARMRLRTMKARLNRLRLKMVQNLGQSK
jgi:hypothetical protein